MEPILQVKNLTYTYSSGTPFEHKALDSINFSLNPGEFIGVIGHTGSGKSTLMQQLNGLLKPTSGQVLLDGEDIWKDRNTIRQARFRVGLVFQYPEYQLFEETVYKDIAFGPKNMGLSEREIDTRVHEAAEIVGLTGAQLLVSPFDLSGGQKRRVAIAGVIAMNPQVLILDEPAAGLDPVGRAGILANIEAYRKKNNAAVIMVSHSMDDVAKMTDRLLVMNHAQLAFDDRPENVFVHAQELTDMGLDIPQITQITMELQKLGINIPNVYTIEQAVELLVHLRKEYHHA